MSKTTTLATGQIGATDHLTVELVRAIETPDVILVRWPGNPVPSAFSPPHRFPVAALAAIAVLDQAIIEFYRLAEAGNQ